ncbi:hypothetical protein [Metabacillus fastidiosus]|uniref:hypothetical protein n=1 Tax=Metabacillus fastidiosus TaxID=1458 RepID=UPI002E24F2B7|nr:hypothetical protein [Metabacillus fastidiosus]
MKLNPVVLMIVLASAVFIGLNINSERLGIAFERNEEKAPVLSPEYLVDYLSKNGFYILPVSKKEKYDIYRGEKSLHDSNIVVQVEIHYERVSEKALVVKADIDASRYKNYGNQKEVENLVNQVAGTYFVQLARIPYDGLEPEAAGKWVYSNLLTSYSDDLKEKTGTKIGEAVISMSGNRLHRTLEISL